MAPCFHVLPAPSPHHSHFPKLISLHFPIVLHLYKFTTSLFTPSLAPKCVPTPASLSPFSLFPLHFMAIPLLPSPSPGHYLISNYIVSHPLNSPSHPPASTCPPQSPIFAFSSFYGPDPLLWSNCTTMTLIVPPNYICGSRNGFSKPYKFLVWQNYLWLRKWFLQTILIVMVWQDYLL